MVSNPRRQDGHLQAIPSEPALSPEAIVRSPSKFMVRQLQDALWNGAAMTSILWNYRTKDWVTGVQATDIDSDGDIEVIFSSRDGVVRVHTPWGAKKWEAKWENQSISALFAIPVSTGITLSRKKVARQACVIVGMRDGQVYALDQYGDKIPDWHYTAGWMIRQIYVNKDAPNTIIIGSEDRHIHLLDRVTGKLLGPPQHTNGWVRCVFSCDLDGDQRPEILAGSGDEYLYLLDDQNCLLSKLHVGHQIYALFAAPLGTGASWIVLTSSNRNALYAWNIQRGEGGKWRCQKEWEIPANQKLFENRIHTIYVHDINNDGEQEILLGSEDGCLYILNQQGSLLWKRRFGSCIYNIWVTDINYDGLTEVLIGAEDSGVHVVQIELGDNIYTNITKVYKEAMDEQVASKNELTKVLTPREKAILKDFVDDLPPVQHVQMEVERAIKLMEEGYYEQALALFLRARRQSVQYCWSQAVTTHGYIWTLGIGQIERLGKYDLIVGTDEGYIYAIDTEQGAERTIWEKDVQNRVRMLQISKLHPDALDSIVAVLSNQRLVILNNQGEIVKEHLFQEKDDWVRCLHVDTHILQKTGESEILLGLENQKIAIWDVNMQQERRIICTAQGVNILSMASLKQTDSTDSVEIIGGSINNQVYAYNADGTLLWTFSTQDRVHALHVEDIDRDGAVEIIVGSEDRNIYVLDHDGHLKWRYRTERGVLDVTICDIKLEKDPEDIEKRMLKIMASSADGHMHVLTAYGDLLWKHKSGNRIRAVRARDLNNDGKVEVAIASANHLELLQVLNQKLVYEYIQTCWTTWFTTKEDRHKAMMELTHHPDEYIRAFALARLAGQHQRYEDDIKRFQEALRSEESQEVKRELVRSVILLLIVPTNQEENARQARHFLRQLSADPDPEIRLEIVNVLPKLLEIDEGLCFEYIEYFTHNVDPWVRRAIVRRLYNLADNYPERIFHLLLRTVQDKEEWIRQETGRVLAHYFDVHPELIIRDSLALLPAVQKEATILEQISYAALHPTTKRWFSSLMAMVTQLNRQSIEGLLEETIAAIQELQEFVPLYGDDFYQVYIEFRRILQIHSSSAIARYQWTNTAEKSTDQSYEIISTSLHLFDEFQEIAEIIRAFERREAIGDRVTSLIMATDKIEVIRKELQQKELHYGQTGSYTPPEIVILGILLEQQYQIIKAEINRLRGSARLITEIRNKEIQHEEEVIVSLLVSNTGVSPADNVKISIIEVEQDFAIIGAREKSFVQIPTGKFRGAEFAVKPHNSAPRLKFVITYDDAERRGKQEEFADVIYLHDRQQAYVEIANPYTSGTPIRSRKMFYGRRDDIDALHKKLSSVTSNKVVVLSGQRRMGKTSLIYQLANELVNGPYVPVIVDLQGQSLDTMGHLFAGLALGICKDAQKRRQITIEEPDREAFATNPIEAFDAFLEKVFLVLHGEKLVFLLDEFEHLQEKINKGPLNEDVLHYLRSLMQHRQGLNFLLVGAPRIRHVTEPLWSIFFNISVPHRLSKLELSEAEALIVEPIKGYLEYDMLALERMHRLSGDLPYFIHVLSEGLITYCNQRHKSYVTINDINNVLDVVLEEQSSSITWIWNQPSSALGRLLLSVLAQDKGEDGRIFTLSDIATEFDAQGMPYEQEKVSDALKDLVREDLIEELNNGKQFRLPIGLVKEWLRKMKPPERVLREDFPQ